MLLLPGPYKPLSSQTPGQQEPTAPTGLRHQNHRPSGPALGHSLIMPGPTETSVLRHETFPSHILQRLLLSTQRTDVEGNTNAVPECRLEAFLC